MKTIVLAGGGTAGHVTPNIALLPGLREAGFTVHYIGLRGGMEQKLVEPLGVPFHGISGGKLRRYADWKNMTDLFRIAAGFREARGVLRAVGPDLVFSKGGFVSTPVVWAARAARIPVVIHESDMTPGLANRLSIPFAKKICYTFPETGADLPKEKGVCTGLPIRRELLSGSAERGRALCGFTDGRPMLTVTGGSQGSAFINGMVRSCLDELLPLFGICHICGKGNLDPSLEGRRGYRQFEYVTETQPDLYAATDLFVSRGGATSIFELLALKKPFLIIPYSRKASRGDQILNAKSFRKQGFCEMLEEEDETGEPMRPGRFLETLTELYNSRSRYVRAMTRSEMQNGAENVLRVLLETAGNARR